MRLRDSPHQYGPVSRLNHWLMAALVLAMLALGLYFPDLPPGAERSFWRTLHIALGTLGVPLLAFRLLWRALVAAPQPLAQAPAARVAARAVHLLLLLAVLAMLTSGVAMQWLGGRPVGVFELLRIASPLSASEAWQERMQQLHGLLAWGLGGLLAVHLLAALRHGWRDGRRFWGRMLGSVK